jgi:8-oxo-dGTP diphosphatase
MENQTKPYLGVALIVMKELEKEVLLGKRKGGTGASSWGFPGGSLKYYELIKHGALRELEEETGLIEDHIHLIDEEPYAITQDLYPSGLHCITFFLRAKYISGNPRLMEPESCEEWKWFNWEEMPSKLFIPVRNLVKKGYNPFENLK